VTVYETDDEAEAIWRDAVRLVVKGRTTIEEAMRISTQLED